jgi:hypothetical protein
MDFLIVTTEGAGPGALCRVTRETEARFYVEVLDWGSIHNFHPYVSGSRTGGRQLYVDKGAVLAVRVTREQYDAYKARHELWRAADLELQRQRKELAERYEAEAGPLLGITQPWYVNRRIA